MTDTVQNDPLIERARDIARQQTFDSRDPDPLRRVLKQQMRKIVSAAEEAQNDIERYRDELDSAERRLADRMEELAAIIAVLPPQPTSKAA